MCGIAGAIGWSERDAVGERLERMKQALRHRGPDSEGAWVSESDRVALGHRRLSIIDLSREADQPMWSVDRRFVIVYNGEIYNYLELRKECENLGSRFGTRSDTEVILECYRHWGPAAFKRFRGMWAFALYDALEKRLVFSRDPFGIKPLYYGFLGGALYFASEPKGLRAVDPVFSEVDEVTAQLFMEHGLIDRGDWTFFRAIKRFPHGHYAVIDPANVSAPMHFERFWFPPAQITRIGFHEAAEELRRLLERSIEMHLRSDVPVGVCLSGGLDSSAIAGLAARKLKNPLRTFTAHYPEFPEIDETKWAQRMIDHTQSRAVFIRPTFQDFVSDLEEMASAQDEPCGSTSIYAQYSVFREVAQSDVRVTLDGQGADESLGGYPAYLPNFMSDRLARNFSWEYLSNFLFLRRREKKPVESRLRNWSKRLGKPKCAETPLYAAGDIRRTPQEADTFEHRLIRLKLPEDSFEQVLVNLTLESNLQGLLRYEDRNSMAHSIEARVPFLDAELVSFLLAMPAGHKIRYGRTKAVLREALKSVIPESVRMRRDKLAFSTPESSWLHRGFGLQPDSAGRGWRELITGVWRKSLMG